jgi:hypothetical protein
LTSTGPSNLAVCESSPPPPNTFCGPITNPPLPTNSVHQH